MDFNINELKKKIIYRSSYRGTKEMDNLMSSFTKKIIKIHINRGFHAKIWCCYF